MRREGALSALTKFWNAGASLAYMRRTAGCKSLRNQAKQCGFVRAGGHADSRRAGPAQRNRDLIGQTIQAVVDDRPVPVTVTDTVFYDKEGARRDG